MLRDRGDGGSHPAASVLRMGDTYRQIHHGPVACRERVARTAVVLVGVGVGVFLVGLVLALILVGRHGGGPIQGVDNRIQDWWVRHRHGLVGAAKTITTVTDARWLPAIAVALSVIALFVVRSARALIPILAFLGGEAIVYAIQTVIHRARPPTANAPAPGAVPGVHETGWAFPSGASVAATAVIFAVLGIVALTYQLWWPWIVALLGSLLVILFPVVLGVHWFSDVAIGLPLGVIWGVTVAWVTRWLEWSDLRTSFRRAL